MPDRHSPDKQAVNFRFPRALVTAYKAAATRNGEDYTAFISRAIQREIDAQHSPSST